MAIPSWDGHLHSREDMVQRHTGLPTGLPCPEELLLCVSLVSSSRPLLRSPISPMVLSLIRQVLHALLWPVVLAVVAMFRRVREESDAGAGAAGDKEEDGKWMPVRRIRGRWWPPRWWPRR
jgi:hypothetical protein